MIVPAPTRRRRAAPERSRPEPDDAVARWLHGLAVRSCDWWTTTSGDTPRLVWASGLASHLVRWAVASGLIADPGFVHLTRAEDALFPVYLDHRGAATDEARRFVMALAEVRGAVIAAGKAGEEAGGVA